MSRNELTMDIPFSLASLLEQVLCTVHENRLHVGFTFLVVHLLHDEVIKDHLLLSGLHDSL